MQTREALETEEAAIRAALAAREPIAARFHKAEERLKRADHTIDSAVRAFNTQRVELIIASIVESGQAWCIYGEHLAPAEGMGGILTFGERWAGDHYYEHLESFSNARTICTECRRTVQVGPGRRTHTSLIDLDVKTVWSNAMRQYLSYRLKEYVTALGLPEEIKRHVNFSRTGWDLERFRAPSEDE